MVMASATFPSSAREPSLLESVAARASVVPAEVVGVVAGGGKARGDEAGLAMVGAPPLLSDDHFSVDGTLVKARASMKSVQPKADDTPSDDEPGGRPGPDSPTEGHPAPTPSETDPMSRPTRQNRNAEVGFKGEKRSNSTHA